MGEEWTFLKRLGEADRGKIKVLSSTALGAKRFVTAVTTASSKLKVFAWELGVEGSVKFLDSMEEEGVVSEVATAGLELHRFVTAGYTKQGELKIVIWDVDDKGQITRRGHFLTNKEDEVFKGKPAVTAFSDNLIVTALIDDKNRLKVTTWKVYVDGSYGVAIERGIPIKGQEFLEEGIEVEKVAVAGYDPYPDGNGNLATAVIKRVGQGKLGLQVINWRIRIDGRIDKLGEEYWDEATDVAATTLSHKRIVTATKYNGYLGVQTWDFDAEGKVSMHDSAEAGKIGSVNVATLSAARIVTAVSDASGNLKLIVWDAIDKIIRLGAAHEKGVKLVTIIPLGGDWIATPVSTAQNNLKIYAWMEHAVALLHSEWVPPKIQLHFDPDALFRVEDDLDIRLVERPVVESLENIPSTTAEIDSTSNIEPASFNKFYLEINGPDPMVAAGFEYLIVSQHTSIAFFDKKGHKLVDANGAWKYSITDFFGTFFVPKLSDNSANEHCINRHLQFPLHGPYRYPPGFRNCDPDAFPPIPPGIVEFYDTRVHFDAVSKRFFIFAFGRPKKIIKLTDGQATGNNDPDGVVQNKIDNQFNRRYWAFAVSKTEDPRDGFYQWMSTEAYVADAPAFTVNRDVMIVSKQVSDIPSQPFGIKPLVYVLSAEDLVKGKPYPRSHKFFTKDFPDYVDGELIPVTHYEDTAGRSFLFQGRGFSGATIYSFKNPSNWKKFSAVSMTTTIVSEYGSEIIDSNKNLYVPNRFFFPPTFRDGKIYYSWGTKMTKGNTSFNRITILRIPLKSININPIASRKSSDGYLRENLPTQFSDYDPTDIISCVAPTITVNKDGHMVVLWCRLGVDTSKPLYPEARYTVRYSDDRGLAGSRLLQKGYASAAEDFTLDYQTAVVDPSDDLTIWMASKFTNNDGSNKMVIGKRRP